MELFVCLTGSLQVFELRLRFRLDKDQTASRSRWGADGVLYILFDLEIPE